MTTQIYGWIASSITAQALIQTIADSCPNLRGLEWNSDPLEKKTQVPEDIVARLLEKCAYLQTLDLHSNVDHLYKISDSQSQPKKVPPPEADAVDRITLAQYIKVVSNNEACIYLRPMTSLQRIELRLSRLFFFDVLEALSRFPNTSNVDSLEKKANYVMHSLLHLYQNEGQLKGLGPEGANRSVTSELWL